MFGMGTGDPSQYGHRQAWYGAWRVGLPAACRGVCSSRMAYPGPGRNADCNLAPQTLLSLELIDTKLIGTRLVRRKSANNFVLRGVNSMDKPNGRLVLVSCTHYCASTSSLSTRWSSWALQGDLILERASRLYAFSGYHNRTSLPSRALGRTTGTQEVRSSRSSRTKDNPPQISYAHSR